MTPRPAPLLLPALFALAACGSTGQIAFPESEGRPPAAIGAEAPPTVTDLLTRPPQAEPERLDDIVERGEERATDEFDLPPNAR
ncbi:MAG: hypothetical protein V2J26_10665 [Pacificimonas sp.]|jgi:predicted small lipoprotein YifL|nr:hypothetical protein [Pacificimonas sp.]